MYDWEKKKRTKKQTFLEDMVCAIIICEINWYNKKNIWRFNSFTTIDGVSWQNVFYETKVTQKV